MQRSVGLFLVLLTAAAFVWVVSRGFTDAPIANDAAAVVEATGGSFYEPDRLEFPPGYRDVLARDRIEPVYEPAFVAPEETGWDPSTLVIGLAVGDEAKAYPVSFLNRREMVVDSIAGIPVLVTW